jgi:L-alanine-DL-glutamate epimerase-like enolase superfamily enzyme
MLINGFKVTRFQFARDRTIGDSQISSRFVHAAALELTLDSGLKGLWFLNSIMFPLPAENEIIRIFEAEVWPSLKGQSVGALAHRIRRPRGGNIFRPSVPFDEAVQQAVWDLLAKVLGLPLWRLLGADRNRVRAYASGLDFHLPDADFVALFERAAMLGFDSFKIKVGHTDIDRDIHRLDLLKSAVGPDATVMADANEAWSPKEAVRNLDCFRRAGHLLHWIEDPILRNDFAGLKFVKQHSASTLVNAGEYLDVSGKRELLESDSIDMLNVHGQITDMMHIGWLAADRGIPVTVGNTFLELGVNLAIALPNVQWLEYSFMNLEHLVEKPFEIRGGYIYASEAPGHGLDLTDEARRRWHSPMVLDSNSMGEGPEQFRLADALHRRSMPQVRDASTADHS